MYRLQPLRLDIKRKLTARSDRVKCVDLHPTEPWMLCSLYSGNINVWNHENQQLVKTFEVCDLPVRAAKFVPRKNWVIAGSDDMHIRVFNYNTLDRVHAFEAHSDYVRCIVVHPTQPYILTSSGECLIFQMYCSFVLIRFYIVTALYFIIDSSILLNGISF